MKNPREYGVKHKAANLSDLMVAKGRANAGEVVNFCPFGCPDEQLDDSGYCLHLVGFTNDGKRYEPFVAPDDRGLRKVTVERVMIGQKEVPVLPKVHKTDVLVPITTSSRVYRETPVAMLPIEEPEDEAAEEEITEEELEAAELEAATRPGNTSQARS